MKKALAIILALTMLFALAAFSGCSKEETAPADTTAPTDTTPEDTTPADTTPEDTTQPEQSAAENPPESEMRAHGKIEAGEPVMITWSSATWDEEFLIMMADSLESLWEPYNASLDRVSSGGDLATQITQIENAITMGADLILMGSPDNLSLENVIQTGIDAGVYMVIFGQSEVPFRVSGTCNTSGLNVGTAQGEMALAWLDSRYPDAAEGSVHAALTTYDGNTESKNRTIGMENTVFADPRVELVYTQDQVMTVDTGYTYAGEALIFDPDIRMFLCFTNGCAIGISNYIISEYGEQPDFDITEWATFGGDRSDSALEMIDNAGKDDGTSVLRGIIYNGDPTTPGKALFTVSYGLLSGEVAAPFYNLDPENTYNCFGFEL